MHTYTHIHTQWLARKTTSPMTNQALQKPVVLIPNHALRSLITSFVEKRGGWDTLALEL
jgi:hypothetical protein